MTNPYDPSDYDPEDTVLIMQMNNFVLRLREEFPAIVTPGKCIDREREAEKGIKFCILATNELSDEDVERIKQRFVETFIEVKRVSEPMLRMSE